jgi:hypothetical protein
MNKRTIDMSESKASQNKNTKPRTGHLFKRGNRYYLSYTIDKRLFSKALRDENGEPVFDKAVAEQLRKKIMAPLSLASQVEALRPQMEYRVRAFTPGHVFPDLGIRYMEEPA